MNKLDVTYHKGLDPQDVVEHFICAFNEKRLEVLNTLWSSPCTFIIKDQIKSYQKYSQAVNFSEIEKEGWKYTKIDSLSKEYSSNKTAIIEFSFSNIALTFNFDGIDYRAVNLKCSFDTNTAGYFSNDE